MKYLNTPRIRNTKFEVSDLNQLCSSCKIRKAVAISKTKCFCQNCFRINKLKIRIEELRNSKNRKKNEPNIRRLIKRLEELNKNSKNGS